MPDLDATAHYAPLPAMSGEGSATPAAFGDALLRNFDVLLVLLAAAPALALGAPALGYGVAAVAWILQRVLQHADRRWIGKVNRFGVNLFEAFGRIWLLAGAIVIAGIAGGRPDGLTAAIVIFAAYSIAFAIRVISGGPALPSDGSER
jgi:hypothetical protein